MFFKKTVDKESKKYIKKLVRKLKKNKDYDYLRRLIFFYVLNSTKTYINVVHKHLKDELSLMNIDKMVRYLVLRNYLLLVCDKEVSKKLEESLDNFKEEREEMLKDLFVLLEASSEEKEELSQFHRALSRKNKEKYKKEIYKMVSKVLELLDCSNKNKESGLLIDSFIIMQEQMAKIFITNIYPKMKK